MGSLEEKKQVVGQIKETLTKSQSVAIVEYRGLTVAEVTELRAKLRVSRVEMKVLKNTMVKRAADEAGLELGNIQGPTAWVFSLEDPVAGPKVILEFAKTHDKLVVKGGILQNKVITAQAIKELADLPSREVLLAKVLGSMQSPLTGMVNVLQGPLRKFVYALEALRKEKEEA
ncbi:MAG: 50S ribosomal protein L10 [Firmicutes bacterium HGW-Firmicutes-12]|nr:MAG: 50S ribosomal protein L10 [Firmicutes bacterium HGW-Firmicutes-12]